MKTFKCITSQEKEINVEYSDNDTIMTALYDQFQINQREPWGKCGGNMKCATCHVEIIQGYQTRQDIKLSGQEIRVLELAGKMHYNESIKSRLGCQCKLKDVETNTLIVKAHHIL
jgi:ferredoxin